MTMNRRDALKVGAGSLATLAGLMATTAFAAPEDAMKMVEEFAGGMPSEGGIDLTTPEIAENGNTVPIEVSVETAMSDDDYVEEVLILADGNPRPDVATFKFTPLAGEAMASTRMRLAKTQNVIAVARMSDGSTRMAKNLVKVTIGGCGG